MWVFNPDSSVKLFAQYKQEKARYPACHLLCLLSSSWVSKALSHLMHGYFLFTPWTFFLCFLSTSLEAYILWQMSHSKFLTFSILTGELSLTFAISCASTGCSESSGILSFIASTLRIVPSFNNKVDTGSLFSFVRMRPDIWSCWRNKTGSMGIWSSWRVESRFSVVTTVFSAGAERSSEAIF